MCTLTYAQIERRDADIVSSELNQMASFFHRLEADCYKARNFAEGAGWREAAKVLARRADEIRRDAGIISETAEEAQEREHNATREKEWLSC